MRADSPTQTLHSLTPRPAPLVLLPPAARLAVLYVFPMFMIPVILVRGCICFKRGSIADKQAFNAWIAQCVADSPVPGICLFPEGACVRARASVCKHKAS